MEADYCLTGVRYIPKQRNVGVVSSVQRYVFSHFSTTCISRYIKVAKTPAPLFSVYKNIYGIKEHPIVSRIVAKQTEGDAISFDGDVWQKEAPLPAVKALTGMRHL